MEKTREITLPNSTDSELIWETNIPENDESKENTVLETDDHIYGNEMENKQETTNIFQLSQRVNPEREIVTSAAADADYSEVTSSPNTTTSNCTLIMMGFNIFICLLTYLHVHLNFSIP
uniref:Uncharacterized protein n=1 Tax=Elaeophora elaphi TaxID=1147741 RepID=A0A0R3S3A8_9BILA